MWRRLSRAGSWAMVASLGAHAQELPAVAEAAPSPKEGPFRSVTSLEGSWTVSQPKDDLWNVGLEHRTTGSWPAFSTVVNGRLDGDGERGRPLGTGDLSLTLRELYAHFQPVDSVGLDAGRFTVQDGMALGFDPTDAFREGSIRRVRTEDPARLRTARLGCVGLRGQWVGGAGQAAFSFAPGIKVPANPGWYDPLWGATNQAGHWHLVYAPPRWGNVASNLVLSTRSDGERVAGFNLSDSLGSSWVVYAETAQARRASFLGDAAPGRPAWRTQASLGGTFTTQANLAVTLEGEWNGFGLPKENPGLAGALQDSLARQEPAGRLTWMAMGQWSRFPLYYSDLTLVYRLNDGDGSGSAWWEWRYNWQKSTFSISGTFNHGGADSLFGSFPPRRTLMALYRIYL